LGSRAVLFILTKADQDRIESATGDDDELMEAVEEIEERWDEPNLIELDKAWDAIHRALTDGQLGWSNGEPPLNQAILGGPNLHGENDYIVILKSSQAVAGVADALAGIDDEAFRERYRQLVPHDYAPEYGEEDLEYSSGWFSGLREFYRAAAERGRAVLFTVDQ
jgi:uncharacterized protein DUF1877